jgi:hypothetical protein
VKTRAPPSQHRLVTVPLFDDFASIRQALVNILNRLALDDEAELRVEDRLAMVDPRDAALHRGCS